MVGRRRCLAPSLLLPKSAIDVARPSHLFSYYSCPAAAARRTWRRGGGIFDCLNRRLHLRCQMYAQRALISHIEPHSPPSDGRSVQLLIFGEFAAAAAVDGKYVSCPLSAIV